MRLTTIYCDWLQIYSILWGWSNYLFNIFLQKSCTIFLHFLIVKEPPIYNSSEQSLTKLKNNFPAKFDEVMQAIL